MIDKGYALGGEQSGHIIFRKHATTGDGVLTSLKIMEVMLEKKMKISDIIKDLVIYPQLLVNVHVKDKKAAMEDSDVVEAGNRIGRELGDDGRILIRESGTEQVIRVMVEAKDDETCTKYVNEVVDILKLKKL